MARKKQISVTLASGVVIPNGALICYYLNGWRTGYLEDVNPASVKIRPIKIGGQVRLVTVPIEDLKEIL